MKIQLIRNATLKISYGEKTVLIDPMLSAKGEIQSFAGNEKNPTVELNVEIDEILDGLDMVLVTHIHPDHFDKKAIEVLPKDLPIVCQNIDKEKIKNHGFLNTLGVEDKKNIEGINVKKTGGKHWKGEIPKELSDRLGDVSGFVLSNDNEPTVYIVGDTIFNDDVKNAITTYKPEIIIVNSGGAKYKGLENNPILMEAFDVIELEKFSKGAKIVAVHMEALDHCTVTRKNLLDLAVQENIEIFVPEDGETLEF